MLAVTNPPLWAERSIIMRAYSLEIPRKLAEAAVLVNSFDRWLFISMDWESTDRMTTCYGLHGPRIESRGSRDLPHSSTPALGPNQPPVQWVPGHFPGCKSAGGWRNHPSHLASNLQKEQGYTCTATLGLHCQLQGELLLFVFLAARLIAWELPWLFAVPPEIDRAFSQSRTSLFSYYIYCLEIHLWNQTYMYQNTPDVDMCPTRTVRVQMHVKLVSWVN